MERLVATLNESNAGTTSWKVNGAERSISVEFSLLATAGTLLSQPSKAEMRLPAIIPSTKVDLGDARTLALLRSARNSDILIFIREQTIGDTEALKKFFASKLAVDKRRLLEKDVQAILSNTRLLFSQLFATANVSVWYQQKKIAKQADLISHEGLAVEKDFLDQVLVQAFKKLYPVYWELKRKCNPDVDLTTRRQTNLIISQFFSIGRVTADTKRSSVAKSVENLAEGLGFALKRGGEFRFGLPGAGIQKAKLDEILNRISASDHLVDLYKFLRRQWGFPEPLIDLYLAALIGTRKIILLDKDKNSKRCDLARPDEIKEIIEDAKKGVEWYLHPPRVLAKDKWSLVKEFLKGIGFDERRFLDQETLTEDQIFELAGLMTAALVDYQKKLENVQRFLNTYEIELSRIEMRSRVGG